MATSKEIRKLVERDFVAGETLGAIAARYNLSTKTIQRWATVGAWRERRKVLPMVKPTKPAARPARRTPPKIDELAIVNLALANLSDALDRSPDPRALGSIAAGLCRLVDLRLKLKPRTAADIADLVIELGIDPSAFVTELKRQWNTRDSR
jgi:hypothetical protein